MMLEVLGRQDDQLGLRWQDRVSLASPNAKARCNYPKKQDLVTFYASSCEMEIEVLGRHDDQLELQWQKRVALRPRRLAQISLISWRHKFLLRLSGVYVVRWSCAVSLVLSLLYMFLV